jgi:hypothetical protein
VYRLDAAQDSVARGGFHPYILPYFEQKLGFEHEATDGGRNSSRRLKHACSENASFNGVVQPLRALGLNVRKSHFPTGRLESEFFDEKVLHDVCLCQRGRTATRRKNI